MENPERPKVVLLSFDVEEFDAPADFGASVNHVELYKTCSVGLERLCPVLDRLDIPATFYITADWAQHETEWVLRLSSTHEIASHTWSHSKFSITDLRSSREYLSTLSGQPVTGLRMPRMQQVPLQAILEAGYQYDSSLNPTWIPGRYNHFRRSRSLHILQDGLLELPVSVSTWLRIPMFWLSFHLLPLGLLKLLALWTLKRDGVLHLYFHPWEFADLEQSGMPAYLRRSSGQKFLIKLARFLDWLSRDHKVTFSTTGAWLKEQAPNS